MPIFSIYIFNTFSDTFLTPPHSLVQERSMGQEPSLTVSQQNNFDFLQYILLCIVDMSQLLVCSWNILCDPEKRAFYNMNEEMRMTTKSLQISRMINIAAYDDT